VGKKICSAYGRICDHIAHRNFQPTPTYPQFKITGLKRLLPNKILRVLKYKKGIQNMAMNYEGVLCQIHGWPKRKQKQDSMKNN